MCVFIHISPTQQSLYLILISDSYSKLSDIWPDWVLWNENRIHAMCDHFTNALINKCIGDDAKAAARQSPNCIKKTKINKIWRKTIFNMADGILQRPRKVLKSGGSCPLPSPSLASLPSPPFLFPPLPSPTPPPPLPLEVGPFKSS